MNIRDTTTGIVYPSLGTVVVAFGGNVGRLYTSLQKGHRYRGRKLVYTTDPASFETTTTPARPVYVGIRRYPSLKAAARTLRYCPSAIRVAANRGFRVRGMQVSWEPTVAMMRESGRALARERRAPKQRSYKWHPEWESRKVGT